MPRYNIFLPKLGFKSAEKVEIFAKVALLFSQPKTFGASTHTGRQIQVLLDPGKRLSIFLIDFVKMMSTIERHN